MQCSMHKKVELYGSYIQWNKHLDERQCVWVQLKYV